MNSRDPSLAPSVLPGHAPLVRTTNSIEEALLVRQRARPSLLTPAFLLIAFSSLAYFTADGILLPTIPLYIEGPLEGGNVAVGISVGAFSLSALLFRPWVGRLGDRRGLATEGELRRYDDLKLHP